MLPTTDTNPFDAAFSDAFGDNSKTHLGLGATPIASCMWGFDGKTPQEPPPEPVPTKKRAAGGRSRYPRRVYVGGRQYWVQNAEEERRLLLKHQRELERKADDATSQPAAQAAARSAAVKISRRVEAVDTREQDWLARLRDEDDEILLVLH